MHYGDLTDSTNLIRIIQETPRKEITLLPARVLCQAEDHPCYLRPAEVELLLGDPSKAKEKLGREPQVKFGELVGMMVRTDLQDQGGRRT